MGGLFPVAFPLFTAVMEARGVNKRKKPKGTNHWPGVTIGLLVTQDFQEI